MSDQNIDLSGVVEAVKNASDKELALLAEISQKLERTGTQAKQTTSTPPVKPDSDPVSLPKVKVSGAKPTNRRKGEIELSLSVDVQTDDATRQPATSKAKQSRVVSREKNSPKSAEQTVKETQQKEAPPPAAESVSASIKDAMAEFKDYYTDAGGKLRRGDGKFASAKEQSAYQSAREVAAEREQGQGEKSTGVMAKLLSTLKDVAIERAKASLTGEHDATEAAGVAAGGSMFYAAKEMYDIGKNTVESAVEAKENVSSVMARFNGKKSENEEVTTGNEREKSEVFASENSKAVDTKNNRPRQPNQLSAAKQQSRQRDTAEILKESSDEREKQIDEVSDQLDELIDAVKGIDNGNGLLGALGNRGFGGFGGKGGKGAKGGKAPRGRVGSVLSGAGDAAQKGGKVGLKSAAKMGASVLGKVSIVLAPALAALDAYNGYNDKEKQKETFNLKDGQEATTGQKSAMAAANVLDLGGLVSGASGLIGSGLEAVGVSGAKEAMTFDAGTIAKGLYDFFAGGKSDKPPASQAGAMSSYESDAIEYRKADKISKYSKRHRAKKERLEEGVETSPHFKDVQKLALERDISYEEARKELSSQISKLNAERATLAKEMGLDISGKFESETYGELYSPQLKREQLAKVDAELSRRKEVEAIAKNGDFSNGRFIDPQAANAVQSLGSTTTAKPQSVASSNERVSAIMTSKETERLRDSDKAQVVKLDAETVAAIRKGSSNGGDSSKVSHSSVEENRVQNNNYRASANVAKSSGTIPNNFSDYSLQRQAADME